MNRYQRAKKGNKPHLKRDINGRIKNKDINIRKREKNKTQIIHYEQRGKKKTFEKNKQLD